MTQGGQELCNGPRRRLWSIGVLAMLWLVACAGQHPSTSNGPAASNTPPTAQQPAPVPTILILDASGSMTTPDAPGPRIDAAKSAAKGLVNDFAAQAQVGLVTYGTGTGSSDAEQAAGCQDVKTLIPLGPLNRDVMDAQIDSLRPSGYTPISLALSRAAALLPGDGSPQAIVLVSDGEDTCGQPPCDIAKQLRQQHPGLSISTVGFRTDGPASEQLNCIATATDGLFVQAANSEQLAARLRATQNVAAAKETLSPNGLAGVTLGSSAGAIRTAHPDFPDVASTGQIVVIWRNCDFGFVDGLLRSIAPHDGGRTIDGVAAGSKVAEAIKFYGNPVGAPTIEGALNWLVFVADEAAQTAFRMAVDGYSFTGTDFTGTIRRIVLCNCLPKAAPSAPVATFDGFGALRIGMTEGEATTAMGVPPNNHFYSCTVLGQNAINTLKVWIADSSGRVTGIDTPAGAKTDRGVGDGTTAAEVRAAYSGPQYSIDEGYVGGQGMQAINVYEGPKSDRNHRLLSFLIGDDGRTGPPGIGRATDAEGC